MTYKIIIADERIWRKDCSKLSKKELQRIIKSIVKLKKDPWAGNVQVKQLKNHEIADCRLRVGSYRILFNKDEEGKEIQLLRVLHRSKLY